MSLPAPARWAELNPLLDELLDLQPNEQACRLAALAEAQPGLAAELAELLRAGKLAAASSLLTGAVEPGPEAILSGLRIGAYRLEEAIGEGGSGTVWRARRDDGQFEGHVAIKLLHLSRLGAAAVARFRREGGILARLTHPNIARLFDAGVAPEGQPYLVLELVEGEPIDAHANRHRLDIRRRIELFQQVILAVTHAHSHLAVHRDIKPSNILVDRNGAVKLLDFGIAKLLEDETAPGDRAGDATLDGARLLTPGYAAPEQLRGEAVTTATDVYALGIVLYGLLAGAHPTLAPRSTPAEAIRATMEADPIALHTALPRDGAQAERVAAERGTSPARLRQQLRGDLSNIVAHCLRKAPGERYVTAAALGEDLRRHLDDEPVHARAGSLLYRSGKFMRKHRLAVGAAAITTGFLVLATIVSTWQMLEARRQRAEATAQAARAEASTRFLSLMVGEIGAEDGALSPTQILDRGMYLLEQQQDAGSKPMVDELNQMGSYYARLNETRKEEEVFARAEALARRLPYAEGLIETLCNQVDTELTLEHRDRAQARLSEAQRLLAGLPRAVPLREASCEASAAAIEDANGHSEAAIARGERALALLRAAGLVDDPLYPATLSRISKYEDDLGRPIEAHRYTELSSQAYDRAGQGGSMDKLTILNNEATDLMNFGEVRQALEVTSDLMRRLQARGASAAVGIAINANHGAILAAIGRYQEAIAALDRTIDDARASKSLFWEERAKFFRARTLVRAGRWSEARIALDDIEKLYRTDAVKNQGYLQYVALARAEWLLRTGAAETARETMDRLLKEVDYPAQSSAWILHGALPLSAEIALARQEAPRAEGDAQAGVGLARKSARDPHLSADLGRALVQLAMAQRANGHAANAQLSLGEAVSALAGGLGPEHPEVAGAKALLAAGAHATLAGT